nr:PTS transporter subunit IIABC [uncultured Lachnoclostridium sp.]
MKDKIFGVLQRVGRSFMLPIAILPVAGLFLGIGGSFTNQTMVEAYGLTKILGEGTLLYNFLLILNECGNIVFANLPILFAMGVAIGMAKKEKEVAALSATIAYFVMHSAISAMINIRNLAEVLPSGSIADTVGISSLQMGVFGGIIVGLGVAALHNRYYKIELPQVISFFGGSRFVPIISAVVYLFVGILMSFIWPAIQEGIYAVGDLVLRSGYAGTWVYGFMERALIPFGLHHVFYLPFWQTAVGGTAVVGGQLIEGAQNIFFAELADGSISKFSVAATRFMSGKFPLMIFGLPGAALAMYQAAKPEKRKVAGGLLLSAALTAMITGITEPIEFTFLFVAPLLYVIHCVFAGLAYMLMHVFNVGVGMTFSGGLIDLTLFGILQGNAKTNWIWVVIVGIGYFLVYYGLFYFLIKKFNYKTPGREDDSQEVKLYTRADVNAAKQDKKENAGADKDIVSAMIVKGLGGVDNISDVDCCATRLRCTVIDEKKVDEGMLKQSGAAGVICKGKGVQIIYGPKVSVIKSNLEDYLENPVEIDLGSESAPEAKQETTTKENTESVVFACPLKGKVDSITTAPDPAFSEKMMGDGIVIVPTDNVVYAPMDCEIAFVFPSKHAIGLVTDSGLEALIHVGIDTVKLEGQGFNVFVNDGDKVKRGDKLMEFDLEYIRNNAADIATPFIITNLPDNQSINILTTGDVEVNTEVMEVK